MQSNRGPYWLIAGVLALVAWEHSSNSADKPANPSVPAVLLSAALDAAAQNPKTDANGVTASDSDPCHEPQRLIAQYRRLYARAADAGTSEQQYRQDAADPARDAELRAAEPRVEHLLALVPDPEESGHTDYFDSVLEGVEEAVAAGTKDGVTYVRDHHWFPWPGGDADKKKLRCWETEPGIVLYRPSRDPAKNPALAVLLVGETPTWGLRQPQFASALALIEKLGAWRQQGDRAELRILGPTFSGTAASLAAALGKRASVLFDGTRSGRALPIHYAIASGTATSTSVQATLEAVSTTAATPRPTLTYASAMPSDSRLLDAMVGFLRPRGARCKEPERSNVVLITESLTAYGSAKSAAAPCYRELKFPPNLASIRQAYKSVTPSDSAAAPITRAPVDATGSRQESQGELSDATPVSHDLALADALRSLSGERVRFVGLVATDVLDVIFLAERIRDQMPDVRLFTLGADIRFLHPTYARTLNGMLIAHAEPVELRGVRSTSLKSEFVGNVFLAGRNLLAAEPLHPNVRISLVGNGTFWQIGPDQLAERSPDARPKPGSARPPMSWKFVFGCALFVLVLTLGLILAPAFVDGLEARRWRTLTHPRTTVGFLRHRGPIWAIIGRCEHRDLAADDALVTIALVSVSACPVLLMLVAWLAREGAEPRLWHSLALLGFILVTLSLSGLWLRKSFAYARLSTKILSGMATFAALCALATGCGVQREATFNLLSGGSPVLAGLIGLAILGLGLWCWRARLRFLDMHRFGVARQRRDFRRMRSPIAEALADGAYTGTGLARIEARLLRIIQSPWLAFSAVPLVIHGLLLCTLMVPVLIKSPRTFEPGWRNTLLIGFGCLTLLPVSGNFSRVVATWITLTRLLQRLAHHPILPALRRLPPTLARSLEAQLTLSTSGMEDLVAPVERLAKLATLGPYLRTSSQQCSALLNAERRYEAGEVGTDTVDHEPSRNTSARAELVDRLLDAASELSKLRGQWDDETQERIDDYVACLVAIFVPRYVRHFRLFVPPLLAGSVLAVLMTSLYFVQPQRLINVLIFIWVTSMVLVVGLVYVALDRDPVISAIGNTTAGSVTPSWGLLGRITSWGIVPLASLLAAQSPDFGYWVTVVLNSVAKGLR